MAVYKRGETWWYSFVYRGRRIQESAGTTRKTLAVEAEKTRRRELERAAVGLPSEAPSERIRDVAGVLKDYGQEYKVNHRERSTDVVAYRSMHLERLLGSLLLSDLTQQRVIGYMEKRKAEGASNRTVNLELQVLSRAVGYTWRALWPKVKKLEENRDAGQALEPEQEQAILEAAACNTSRLIHPFLFTLAWTGMRSDEARTLTWGQVDFEVREIRVGKAKTDAGSGRRIPMSASLEATLGQHASWCASQFGTIQPEWYVFPFCRTKRPVDPSRPVTSLKRAWESVREAVGVECRLHDLRHSFCTKLAEAGVPEQTMLDIMGHVSPAMLRRYSHIRAKARRDAIDALEAKNSVGVSTISTTVEGMQPRRGRVTH